MGPYESMVIESLKRIDGKLDENTRTTAACVVGVARCELKISQLKEQVTELRAADAAVTPTVKERAKAAAVPTAAVGGLVALVLEIVSRFGQ